MYLDTTILQSRTTTTLVEFIESLVSELDLEGNMPNEDLHYGLLEIRRQYAKACIKRGAKITEKVYETE